MSVINQNSYFFNLSNKVPISTQDSPIQKNKALKSDSSSDTINLRFGSNTAQKREKNKNTGSTIAQITGGLVMLSAAGLGIASSMMLLPFAFSLPAAIGIGVGGLILFLCGLIFKQKATKNTDEKKSNQQGNPPIPSEVTNPEKDNKVETPPPAEQYQQPKASTLPIKPSLSDVKESTVAQWLSPTLKKKLNKEKHPAVINAVTKLVQELGKESPNIDKTIQEKVKAVGNTELLIQEVKTLLDNNNAIDLSQPELKTVNAIVTYYIDLEKTTPEPEPEIKPTSKKQKTSRLPSWVKYLISSLFLLHSSTLSNHGLINPPLPSDDETTEKVENIKPTNTAESTSTKKEDTTTIEKDISLVKLSEKDETIAELSPTPELNKSYGITRNLKVPITDLDNKTALKKTYDLYTPTDASKITPNTPFIVMLHQGGWVGGARKLGETYAKKLAEAGFVVANLDYLRFNYSGKKMERIPYQINDVTKAIKVLQEDVTKTIKTLQKNYEGTYGNTYIVGGSSGGHIGLLSLPELKGVNGIIGAGTPVFITRSTYAGSKTFKNGAFLTLPTEEAQKQWEASRTNLIADTVPNGLGLTKKTDIALSPIAYKPEVFKGSRFLFLRGSRDNDTHQESVKRFHQRLQTAGIDSNIADVAGGHKTVTTKPTDEIITAITHFIKGND